LGLGLRLWFADSACIDVVEEYQRYLFPDSGGFFLANTTVDTSSVTPSSLSAFKTKLQMKFLP
jgi:hypothetical protein